MPTLAKRSVYMGSVTAVLQETTFPANGYTLCDLTVTGINPSTDTILEVLPDVENFAAWSGRLIISWAKAQSSDLIRLQVNNVDSSPYTSPVTGTTMTVTWFRPESIPAGDINY